MQQNRLAKRGRSCKMVGDMSTIYDQITAGMKAAMLGKDQVTLGALRSLKAALQNAQAATRVAEIKHNTNKTEKIFFISIIPFYVEMRTKSPSLIFSLYNFANLNDNALTFNVTHQIKKRFILSNSTRNYTCASFARYLSCIFKIFNSV